MDNPAPPSPQPWGTQDGPCPLCKHKDRHYWSVAEAVCDGCGGRCTGTPSPPARMSEEECGAKTCCEMRAEIAALTKALYESYTWTGADTGDEDDFRALVNKCEAVPREVRRIREEHDKAEADYAAAKDLARAFRAERDRLKATADSLREALEKIAEETSHGDWMRRGTREQVENIARAALAVRGEEKP